MEKCAGCHWHCTGIRRCKAIHTMEVEIDSDLIEGGLYSISGNFQTLPLKCTQLKSNAPQAFA